MPAGLRKEPAPWNSSSGGVTKLETHRRDDAMSGSLKDSIRHNQWCERAGVLLSKVILGPHRRALHTNVSKVWCASSLSAASSHRQSPSLQNTEALGAIPHHSRRLVSKKQVLFGSVDGPRRSVLFEGIEFSRIFLSVDVFPSVALPTETGQSSCVRDISVLWFTVACRSAWLLCSSVLLWCVSQSLERSPRRQLPGSASALVLIETCFRAR